MISVIPTINSTQKDEFIRRAEGFLDDLPICAILLDRRLYCIHTNRRDIFPIGFSLRDFIYDDYQCPMYEFTHLRLMLNDSFYCARVIPVKDESDTVQFYVCEIIDSQTAADIIGLTDACVSQVSLSSVIEYFMSDLKKITHGMIERTCNRINAENAEALQKIEKLLTNMESSTRNSHEYYEMLFSRNTPDKILSLDAVSYMSGLVERCNSYLKKCGRRVKLICENCDMWINANGRHAMVALVNAIQNSILYSPRDTVPKAELHRVVEKDRKYVECTFTNDNIAFKRIDFRYLPSVDFQGQRIGYGIPIIRRFAEECGGSVTIRQDEERTRVTIRIPAIHVPPGKLCFASLGDVAYDDNEVSDIIRVKMLEAVNFFGSSE